MSQLLRTLKVFSTCSTLMHISTKNRPTIGWTILVLIANGNEYSTLIRPTNGWTKSSTNCKWQ